MLLVQLVLVHLFLKLFVFFVKPVDLPTEVLTLPLQSLDLLGLLFDLLCLFVVPVFVDLQLGSQGHQLLGFRERSQEGVLVSVAGRLGFVGLE